MKRAFDEEWFDRSKPHSKLVCWVQTADIFVMKLTTINVLFGLKVMILVTFPISITDT
jgi:hypothetical protein